MATPQLSPGVLVREVDLTVGRADNVLDNIGAICGPFENGPVEEVTNIPKDSSIGPFSNDTISVMPSSNEVKLQPNLAF